MYLNCRERYEIMIDHRSYHLKQFVKLESWAHGLNPIQAFFSGINFTAA